MPQSLIEEATHAITYAAPNKSLSDLIERQIDVCAQGKRPADYFYLTELVNPMDAYWHRKAAVPQPLDILKKLKYGQKMHSASRFWFAGLPGYAVAEASLVGEYVGIPGVVGQVDFTVGHSIFEFKTKDAHIVTADDVWDHYPQDLEQLAFYATLSPDHPRNNVLVYMTRPSSGRVKFTAFRAEIKEFEPIKDNLLQRVSDLKRSLSSSDPSGLPQCRYFVPGCRFGRVNTCSCGSAKLVGARNLAHCLTLKQDEELGETLLGLYEANRKVGTGYEAWNLLLPRKWYHDYFDYAVDEELASYGGLDPDKLALNALLDSAIHASELAASRAERLALQATDALGLSGGRRFIKIKVPARGKGPMIVPYIRKGYNGRRIPSEYMLPDTYYGELGLQCARSGVDTGVAVVHFPKAGGRTVCYVYGFDLEKITHAANSVKEALREARQDGNPDVLAKCPDYMRENCQFQACSCREL